MTRHFWKPLQPIRLLTMKRQQDKEHDSDYIHILVQRQETQDPEK